MKNLFLTVTTLTLAVLAQACAEKHERPRVEEPVHVYTFEKRGVLNADTSLNLIEKFLGRRDTGDTYTSDENTVYYVSREDVNRTFEQDLNTQNLTFNKGRRKLPGDGIPNLPSKEKAVGLAEEFLNNNGLLPKNKGEMRLAHLGGLRSSQVLEGKKPGPIVDEMITVTYGRTLDNLRVIGPGSKIVVNVGDNGEVMGLIHRWRELKSKERVAPEGLIPQQQAEEMAKRQILAEYGKEVSYKILGSGRAYYDNNGSILQPVYVFETSINLQGKDERVRPFNYLCVIPMLRNSPEPLNLTAIAPEAKRLIKTVPKGEHAPSGSDVKPSQGE